MKHRITHAYPLRLTFMIAAGATAIVIIQIRNLLGIPSMIRRAMH